MDIALLCLPVEPVEPVDSRSTLGPARREWGLSYSLYFRKFIRTWTARGGSDKFRGKHLNLRFRCMVQIDFWNTNYNSTFFWTPPQIVDGLDGLDGQTQQCDVHGVSVQQPLATGEGGRVWDRPWMMVCEKYSNPLGGTRTKYAWIIPGLSVIRNPGWLEPATDMLFGTNLAWCEWVLWCQIIIDIVYDEIWWNCIADTTR